MLEDRTAREEENRLRNEERDQLRAEVSRLTDALAQKKSAASGRGCFAPVQSNRAGDAYLP